MKKIVSLLQTTIKQITQKSGLFLLNCTERGEDRADLPLLHGRGFASMPKKNENAWVLQVGAQRIVLNAMHRCPIDLKEGEVCVLRDERNYILLNEKNKLEIKIGDKNFFKLLDATLEKIENQMVVTGIGEMPLSPKSKAEISLQRNELKKIAEM